MATKAKDSLVNAFLLLVENEDYDKITVTNLVDECGVSRQTFYYHFDDIAKMIEWAFQNETKKISDGFSLEEHGKIADMYTQFLCKYDMLFKKASKSTSFIIIYNHLFDSFYAFLTEYIAKKHNRPSAAGDEADFFVSYCAGAFSGLVVKEVKKPESDYEGLMNKLVKGLNSI